MSRITASDTGGIEFELPPSGNHLGYCVQMIHLGHVPENFNGEEKVLNKVRLVFELSEHKREFKEGEGKKCMRIKKDFTVSLSPNSNLRPFLESWRGRGFKEEELKEFDISTLAGVPALINVIHRTSKRGKEYADIASLSYPPKVMRESMPGMEGKKIVFGFEPFEQDVFDLLSDWLKDRVKQSKEFKALQANNVTTEPEMTGEVMDDDLPF